MTDTYTLDASLTFGERIDHYRRVLNDLELELSSIERLIMHKYRASEVVDVWHYEQAVDRKRLIAEAREAIRATMFERHKLLLAK